MFLDDTTHPAESRRVDRRTVLAGMSTIVAAAVWPGAARGEEASSGRRDPRPNVAGGRLRKIATEEAFTIPEIAEAVREVVRRGGPNLDLKLLNLIYGAPAESPPSGQQPATANRDAVARVLLPRLLDLDAGRLADMDANGVDVHLLSLGVPGVQASVCVVRDRSNQSGIRR
jgi:5-carboxyvanillate decarboxylase